MSNQRTKYDQILEYVRDGILSGRFAPGERLPSDTQLVRMFSSSRPTAAKAMHDLEKEGYLKRKTGSGSYVRMRSDTQPSLIGMLTPEIGKAELFAPICRQITSQCKKHNLSLLHTEWAASNLGDQERERQAYDIVDQYISVGVVGVFFAPVEFSEHMRQVNFEIARRLEAADISIILLDRDLEEMPNRSHYDLIGVDNFRVGMLQANHFISLGETRIAYVSRGSSAPTIDLRIAGYRYALQQSDRETDPPMVFNGDVENPVFVSQIIDAAPSAIVCSNDRTALLLMQSLNAAGIQIPQDIKLIGVDDVEIAASAPVPLTTIRQPCREIGSLATEKMVKRIEHRTRTACTVSLTVELVVRQSCGAALRR